MNENGKKVPDYEKIDETDQVSKYAVASLCVIGRVYQEQYSKFSLIEKIQYLFSLSINECMVKDKYLMKTMGKTALWLFVIIAMLIAINGMFFPNESWVEILIPAAVFIAYNYFKEHSRKINKFQDLKLRLISGEFRRLESSFTHRDVALNRYIEKYGDEFDYRNLGAN